MNVRIATETLPKNLRGKEPYIEGYFYFTRNDQEGYFATKDGVLFRCTRPFMLHWGSDLMVLSLAIKLGNDNSGKAKYEAVELSVFLIKKIIHK